MRPSKKTYRILLVLVILIFLGSALIRWRKPGPLKANEVGTFHFNGQIVNMGIYDEKIFLWDGDTLSVVDEEGNELYREDYTGKGLISFFAESHPWLYDKDLNRLYRLDGDGKEDGSFLLEGELYQLKDKNFPVAHLIKDGGEELADLSGKDPRIFFQTENFILGYEIINPENRYVVGELSTSAAGYKTTVFHHNGELKKYDFPSEVALNVWLNKDNAYILTEKMLRKISPKEILEKEVPTVTAVLPIGEETVMLHSGILSRYNKNLEETEKTVLAANTDKLKDIDGRLYTYGHGEVAGNLLDDGTFYLRPGDRSDRTLLEKDLFVTEYDNDIHIYRLVKDKKGGN